MNPGTYNAGMARVLVVEDDPAILQLLERLLLSLGHTSITARTGNEAVKLLRLESYDLVITDLTMPRGSGFELLAWMDAERLRLPVIICSAYASFAKGDALESLVRDCPHVIVSKPFEAQHITQAVRKLVHPTKPFGNPT